MHLIVGCGLSGAVVAERIATVRGEKVLVVDRRDHVGGNVHDYKNDKGITVHKYGPHAFHTSSREVWDYLSRFTRWKPYWHRVEAFIDGESVPLPFNFNSICALFPERHAERLIKDLTEEFGFGSRITVGQLRQSGRFSDLADYIHEKVYKNYTAKQWGANPDELDAGVAGRVPVMLNKDNRYFHDVYQAIPAGGYTDMVEAMLDSPNIRVELGVDFKAGDAAKYASVTFTGMMDEYFGYSLGRLPYRSLRFEFETLEQEYFQATAQRNYPNNFDFTRITEFKHFLDERSLCTTIAYEYPFAHRPGENEPYYPVPCAKSGELYRRYAALASQERKTAFLGRLAEYKYYNMDQAVESALSAFARLNSEGFFGTPRCDCATVSALG